MPPEENDPTEEQIKAEIAAAVEILRSDGMHIHKTYAEFQKSLTPETEPPKPEPKEGDPPPVKDDKTDVKPVKGGLWWGTRQ